MKPINHIPSNSSPPFTLPFPPTHTVPVCFCVYVYFLDLSSTNERNHMAFVFLNLAYFSYPDGLQFHLFIFTLHGFILPYDWIKLHYIFISCKTSGLFHSLAIVNSAAINIGVQVSPLYPDLYSFRYMPRNGIIWQF
jgi:hypothetical protein